MDEPTKPRLLRAKVVAGCRRAAPTVASIALVVAVVVLGTANRVLYKVQLVPMANYPLLLGWLLTAAYSALYGGVLLARLRWLPPEQRRYAVTLRGASKFAVMGLMDAVGYIVGLFSAAQISGYLLTLLPQAIIPMTMVATVVLLRRRYAVGQLLGALVLMAGIVFSLVPTLDAAGPSSASTAGLLWAAVYLASVAPNAVSFTLKEMVFRDVPGLDIFVVNTMDSLWQMAFTYALLPVVSLPGFGGVPFSQLGAYIADGATCLFTGAAPTPHDDCRLEPWVSLLYVAVNLAWNICMLLLLRQGGAVLMFIASAVSLPISHLAFALPWPRLPATPLSPWDAGALVTVLLGLVLYRYFTDTKPAKAARAAKAGDAEQADETGPLLAINHGGGAGDNDDTAIGTPAAAGDGADVYAPKGPV